MNNDQSDTKEKIDLQEDALWNAYWNDPNAKSLLLIGDLVCLGMRRNKIEQETEPQPPAP